MSEEARPAVAADLDELGRLHRAATEELRAEKGGVVWARHEARDAGARFDLDDPDQLVLAGTFDGAVVGYGRVLAQRLADGGELAVLTDLYVTPAAREVGVGECVLDAAIAWARDRGCIGIDSVALPGMRASKNFFEAAGMVARAIVVHRSFGAAAP